MARHEVKRNAARDAAAAPTAISDRALRALLGAIQVVTPLLFFTNLTRNPYFTQIALLNIGIAVVGVLWASRVLRDGQVRFPRLPLDAPLAAFLLVALASTLVSYARHSFVRPGIAFEGTRVWVFTLINSVAALYLPLLFVTPLSTSRPKSIWTDLSLGAMWSVLWLGFYSIHDTDPSRLIWDTYGAFLWILAAGYAILRTRDGEALSFFHVIFVVAGVAALYALSQYSGRDVIWANPVQPYGGRPVSTFGNPNFLSSHLMMLVPVALGFAIRSRGPDRWGYATVASLCTLATLATLTRSSYMGLLAGGLVLAVGISHREPRRLLKPAGILTGALVLLVLIFPKTPVSAVQSPIARFTEIFAATKSHQSYGPWDQRVLIWSSAWDMVRGSPLIGVGWGCFELFYPFFQGRLLLTPWYAPWRTHANNAHNVLLELWSQTGALGAGAALWMLVALLVGGAWVLRRRSDAATTPVVAGLLGGLAGMAVDNFFGNVSIFFAVPAFLFWWLAGTMFAEGGAGAEAPVRSVRSFPVMAVVVLVGIISLFSAGYYIARWNQEVNYFDGFKRAKYNDLPSAIKSLEAAYHWFPGEVNGNYELGNSYAREAKMLSERGLPQEARAYQEKAVWAYEQAMRANPGYDELYFNLGVTRAQLGQTEQAERDIEMSICINPLLKDAYTSLGNLYMSGKKWPEALRVFQWSASGFPKEPDMWNSLGYIYTQMGNHEEALKAYKRAVMLNPSFSSGWQNLMNASTALGRQDPILEVPGLIRKMEAALQRSDYTEANAEAERIAVLMPDSADAHLSLANTLYYVGKKDESETEYKKAIELRPNFGVAHANLGRLYQSEGHFDLARSHLQQALEITPNDADVKKALDALPAR